MIESSKGKEQTEELRKLQRCLHYARLRESDPDGEENSHPSHVQGQGKRYESQSSKQKSYGEQRSLPCRQYSYRI